MSKDEVTMSSPETATVSKKERRDKKDKKERKDKKRSKAESNNEVDMVDASEEAPAETAETPKKRKREILPDELEIDVNLPEPASKKAARKAKKAKLNPTPPADADTAAKTDGEAKEDKDTGKRSEYGVWIGNLPWSATKDSLRNFLCENSDIKTEQITRVHLPPPTKPANPNWTNKPLNKGFAYVDFSTELAMYSCIALTETKMDGRALLIKNAKSFEGRPDKPKTEQEDGGRGAKGAAKSGHPPNKRVFVGNLSFDVTKSDLEYHYGQAGEVEHIHMATFEDSGKCKGYAWVTFADVEAATSAVNGFVFKDPSAFKSKKDKHDSDDEADTKKAGKKRKWLLNKIAGREVRCEFAEDATTRYNKRYGKEKPADAVDGVNPDRWKNFGNKGGDKRFARQDKGGKPDGRDSKRKVDPRTIRSGAAHSNAPRASQAIVESQGKKTTFE